jgi:hypothetical protein
LRMIERMLCRDAAMACATCTELALRKLRP